MEKRFICNLPWEHLSIFPHSTSTVCCEAKHSNGAPGHAISLVNGHREELSVKKYPIIDIINSDNYRAIRRDMLDGQVPEACEGCHKVEQNGGRSKRLRESWKNIDHDALTAPDGSIQSNVTTIELRLGNFCNLKCRSCNAESSTSWIQDYYKLKDKVELASGYIHLKNSPTTNYDWVDDPTFYDSIIENSPNLRSIYISGGEPFLVPKHFYLLEKLIEIGRTDIAISYHTNLNYNIDKLKPSLDLLAQFPNVTLNFSIDDLGDRNDYIRANADWQLMIDNLKVFYEKYPFRYHVTQTFNAYNFMYAEELENFLSANGINIPIFPNHVHSPAYLNANVLPIALRQEKLNSIKGKVSDDLFNDLYGRYFNAPDNDLINDFWKFTDEVDVVRKEDFAATFPELNARIKR